MLYNTWNIHSFNSAQNILNLLPFLFNKYSFHCIQLFFLLSLYFLKNKLAYIALKHDFCDISHSSSLTYLPHCEAMRIIRLCFEATSSHHCNSVFWNQKSLTFLTSTSRPHDLIITFLPFPAFCAFWLLQDPMRPPRPCFHNCTTTFAQIHPNTERAALRRQPVQPVTLMNGRHRQLSSHSTSSLNHMAYRIQAWLTILSHKTSAFSLPPKKLI